MTDENISSVCIHLCKDGLYCRYTSECSGHYCSKVDAGDPVIGVGALLHGSVRREFLVWILYARKRKAALEVRLP